MGALEYQPSLSVRAWEPAYEHDNARENQGVQVILSYDPNGGQTVRQITPKISALGFDEHDMSGVSSKGQTNSRVSNQQR